MSSGDTIRIHMHDTPAGYRVDINDLTTQRHRLDDGQQGQRVRPGPVPAERQDLPRSGRTRSTRSISSAVRRGNDLGRAHLQRGGLGRDRPLRVLQRHRPDHGRVHQPRWRRHDARRRRSVLPRRRELLRSADPDHRVLPRRRRLRRAVVPARLAGHVRERGSSTERCIRTPMRFTVPTSAGQGAGAGRVRDDMARIERGEPGNPPVQCDGPTGANCVNPPPGAQFYPIYIADQRRRPVLAPAGRHAHPGHDEHVRRDRRRPSTAHLLFVHVPERRIHDDPAGRGLPQGPRRQSLLELTQDIDPGAAIRPPRGQLAGSAVRVED